MEKWTEIWQDSRGMRWELEFEEVEEGEIVQLMCEGHPIKKSNRRYKCDMTVATHDDFPGVPPNYGFLHHVSVHPDYQGAGLGTRLVRYALEWLKSKGRKGCAGFLEQDEATMDARAKFFRRLGFIVPPSNTTIKKSFE